MKSTMGLFAALLMIGISAGNCDAFPSEFDEKPVLRFAPSNSEHYGPPEPALKQLLVAESKNGATNEFCVVGYAYADRIVNVWVHWINEQHLLMWRGNSDEELCEQGLVMAQRDLSLAGVAPSKVGLGALVMVGVVLDLKDVLNCNLVAGDFDYLLKIRVRDKAEFNKLHGQKLIALPGVRQTRTFFVMKEVKENARIAF
jgi:Lrp/AsnC family leucine-responsive transcriptional regulator